MSGSEKKRGLRAWVLQEFGNGNVAPCAGCGRLLNNANLTLDRFPVPGKFGGTYRRGNLRPQCARCNNTHVGEPTDWGEFVPLTHRPFLELAV